MLELLRKPLQKYTETIAKIFIAFHPNILSLAGIFFFLPGVYFLATGNSLLGTLFVIGVFFDKVDGDVARLTNQKTQFGGVLDATIDRFTEGLVLMGVGIGGLAPWWLLFIIFNTSICISYIKAKAEAASSTSNVGKNQFSVGITQRGDRVALLFFGLLMAGIFENLLLLEITLWITLLLQTITLVWRGIAIYKVLK